MQRKEATSARSQAGVWIDHRQAWVVLLSPSGAQTTVIRSGVEKHPERSGDSPMRGRYESLQVPADDRQQRALTGALNRYYDAVGLTIRLCDRILIFGPGEAKGQFRARLGRMMLGEHVEALQSADTMTEPQVVARVQEYFGLGARRVQAPR